MSESEQQTASHDHELVQDGIEEIKKALGTDSTRLGEVWDRPARTPQEIAEELGVPTSGLVYSYRRIIASLVNGEVPAKPTAAKQVASALRGFAKRHEESLSEYTAASTLDDTLPERRFHKHLRAADHGRNVSRAHGREWFLTHPDFLDDTADILGLSKHYERPEDE